MEVALPSGERFQKVGPEGLAFEPAGLRDFYFVFREDLADDRGRRLVVLDEGREDFRLAEFRFGRFRFPGPRLPDEGPDSAGKDENVLGTDEGLVRDDAVVRFRGERLRNGFAYESEALLVFRDYEKFPDVGAEGNFEDDSEYRFDAFLGGGLPELEESVVV